MSYSSSHSTDVRSRNAVVTGGANGIGEAIVRLYHRSGIRVCLVDCDVERGSALAAELTATNPLVPVWFVSTDLAKPWDIESSAAEIVSMFGTVDILVNNAGIEIDRDLGAIDAELWDQILDVNLRAPFLLTRALLPAFAPTGASIINISSIHATYAFPGAIPYACSKAGLVALTRNLALELADRRIRANVLLPGYIDTRLWEEYLQKSGDAQSLAAETAALHPVGRRGVPNDVAQAALYLASEESAFINGAELVIDGGLTIRAHT